MTTRPSARRALTLLAFTALAAAPGLRAVAQTGVVDGSNPMFGTYLGPTYAVPAGGATYGYFYDGYNSGGTVNHFGNTLTLTSILGLIVGENPGSTGVYNLGHDANYNPGTLNFTDARGSLIVGDIGTGTFNQSDGTATVPGTVIVGNYSGAGFSGTGTYNLSGGTLNAGAVLLGSSSGGNRGTGTFNLTGGALAAGQVAGGGGTSTFNFNGGYIRATASSATFFQGLTTANVRNSGASIDTNGFSVTVAQPLVHSTISGDAATDGGFSKAGAGTLILTGNNTYTGATAVNGGTLQVGNGGATGTLGSGGVFNNASLVFNRSDAGLTVGGVISRGGSLTQAGSGTTTLTGANTYTGTTTISAGTLALGNGGATGTLSPSSAIINNGTLAFNRSNAVVQGTDFSSAAITGTGGVLQLGSGTVTLSPVNTYTGTTHVDPGTLRAGGASTASAGPFGVNSAVVMDNVAGATLDLNGYSVRIGSLTGGGAAGGNVTLGAGTLTVGGNNTSPAAYAGVISGTGSLVKAGTGTLLLTGANTYSGGTVVNGGEISAPNPASLGTGTVTFANGGVQFSAGSANDYSPRFSPAANQNLTVDSNGQNGAFAAGFNSSGGTLTKIGAGTLALNAANTYTGATTVNAGTLLVNNTNSGTGTVTVQNGGSVLGGAGTLAAPVSVTTGTLSPSGHAGAGTATNTAKLTTGALTLASTASSVFDLASGTVYDQLVANGNIVLAGTLTLNVPTANQVFTAGQVLDLFHANTGSTLTGAFSNLANGGSYTYGGETFLVFQNLTDFELIAQTTVPEPATWLGGFGAAGLLGLALRRRDRQA